METPSTFRVKPGPGSDLTHCGACGKSLVGRVCVRPIRGPLADSLLCDQACTDLAHAPLRDPEDKWR
jgi:hypothetical protein